MGPGQQGLDVILTSDKARATMMLRDKDVLPIPITRSLVNPIRTAFGRVASAADRRRPERHLRRRQPITTPEIEMIRPAAESSQSTASQAGRRCSRKRKSKLCGALNSQR